MTSPILDFDPDPGAILQPDAPALSEPTPAGAVACFFNDVLGRLAQTGTLTVIGKLKSEIGENPLYALTWQGTHLLVFHPGVGAPLAVGFLEEVAALGIRQFIACGGAGVLDKAIVAGHPVILTGAVRDEGTSYHYLPPSRVVSASPRATAALEAALKERKIDYLLGKAWTTDAIYRETVAKRARRISEGCCVVEMEAAAFFAVAEMRGLEFGQIVYGGDLVVPEGWDGRAWHRRDSSRELMFWLAVEACARLVNG